MLSKEFQARVQLNLPRPDKQKSIDILMLYDWYDKRAELVTDENVNGDEEIATQAFYYDKNEIFTYERKMGGYRQLFIIFFITKLYFIKLVRSVK